MKYPVSGGIGLLVIVLSHVVEELGQEPEK